MNINCKKLLSGLEMSLPGFSSTFHLLSPFQNSISKTQIFLQNQNFEAEQAFGTQGGHPELFRPRRDKVI